MHPTLITGGESNPLLPQIRESISKADRISLAVSFIKSSGMELIFNALEEAVVERGARLSVLTSDYLGITDPQALRSLMLLVERGADVRVFRTTPGQSFHLKAYIFTKGEKSGAAFVGSSNISKAALTTGIEWNYKIEFGATVGGSSQDGMEELREAYQALVDRPETAILTYDWIEEYESRRLPNPPKVAPGSDDPDLPKPQPTHLQVEALTALGTTRKAGYKRGLVVLATGLGKTYLAAFDTEQVGAERVLFVAHREEILLQAERSFQLIHPSSTVGKYGGGTHESDADMVFASVQTLGRESHLERFPRDWFDYIVIDEFHHAAATTYRRLLRHFEPKFLLGLTATPERTDQSDILSLCDDNLVFQRDLFFGVESGSLSPFTYFGIYDESVEYDAIPWRNGSFDPEALTNRLATLARFRHIIREWREKGALRTLAFCSSKKHAQFMADRFVAEGIRAAAVYGGSDMARDESLALMESGDLEVIFSVDLFSEGVDLPLIDTVMMLRPTESKILFLQQLGRGLRIAEGKERLVILDFIGNHKGFFNKPSALFGVAGNQAALREFARKVRDGDLELPPGCFVNYDLEIIDFLETLKGSDPLDDYGQLASSLGRRPTLSEFYRSGTSMQRLRSVYGDWWGMVHEAGDLTEEERSCHAEHSRFLEEIEKTKMTKSFKTVLLESLLEVDGLLSPLSTADLAASSLEVFKRRRHLIGDIRTDLKDVESVDAGKWHRYWLDNPINAWVGGNKTDAEQPWFTVDGDVFRPTFAVDEQDMPTLKDMLQELIDYRYAAYESRPNVEAPKPRELAASIPFFESLAIACGHFRSSDAKADVHISLPGTFGQLDVGRHFVARATGDSMNGGAGPVKDGDHLLLELQHGMTVGDLAGATVAVERPSSARGSEFVLRIAETGAGGESLLVAANPEYGAIRVEDDMRIVAKLIAVLGPLDLAIGKEFMREAIPALFGTEYNPGNWNSGHVVLGDQKSHVLLVTLNKQGKAEEHRYLDRFSEDGTFFHWQSQNSTSPESKRGRELIDHEQLGLWIHLFVRQGKLRNGKAAPFTYHGPVSYVRHAGSKPVDFTFQLSAGSDQ